MQQKRIEKEPAIWETGGVVPDVMELPAEPIKAENTSKVKKHAPPADPKPVTKPTKPQPKPAPEPTVPPILPPSAPAPTLNLPEKIETEQQLQAILDQDPPAEWLKIHPDAHGQQQPDGSYLPYYYLPINRQKQIMQAIFKKVRREVLDTKALKNSIVVTMRVHYLNPASDQWECQDGLGASSAAASLVQMAAPGAGSRAYMDAVKNIGRIFGRDLNKEGGEPVEANFTLNA